MNADRVAMEVMKKYDELKIKEDLELKWTVLAGVVVKVASSNDLNVVCIATGTEALSNRKRDFGGILLVDCHAEVLAHRLFTKFVLQELTNNRQNSKYFEKKLVGSDFIVKNGVEFALYISQSPCGDCSTEALESRSVSESPRKERNCNSFDGKVYRGREDYRALAVLRTKPGRADAETSDTMSCSDKIAKWLCIGVGGSFLGYHFSNGPIRLSMLVIGQDFHQIGLERAINERTSSWRQRSTIPSLEIKHTRIEFRGQRKEGKVSSSISTLWYEGMPYSHKSRVETVILGRMQGFVLPINNVWSLKASPCVSKVHLALSFLKSLLDDRPDVTLNLSYKQLKQLAFYYQKQKAIFLKDPFFCGWKCSIIEFECFTINPKSA